MLYLFYLLIYVILAIYANSQSIINSSDETSRPKRDHMQSHSPHAEKYQMSPADLDMEPLREPRGPIREHWVKQPYPVEHRENNYEDNSPAPSDKAPRVHFVTQRRSESSPSSSVYGNYEREARSRDMSRDTPAIRDEPQTALRDMSRGERTPPIRDLPSRDYDSYYQPRYTRNYNPYSFKSQRFDPYYYYDEQERYQHNPRLENNYFPDRNRYTSYSANKQRRIIYYATLPEVVRTPPNVDLRDRFSYNRDRYDDKFLNSPMNPLESFRFRKPYPKSRFEEDVERSKAPYPLKVSTDVNVREIKKNPERRIYSEVDRSRYGFKTPQYSQSN